MYFLLLLQRIYNELEVSEVTYYIINNNLKKYPSCCEARKGYDHLSCYMRF